MVVLCTVGVIIMQSCGASPALAPLRATFRSVNTARAQLYEGEDCKSAGAISSLITPEIELDGTPAFLQLLSPSSLSATYHTYLYCSADPLPKLNVEFTLFYKIGGEN